MSASLPPWVEGVTAVLVVAAALLALTGSLGLVRLPDFFQRVHAPTLGTTGATWLLTLATVLNFSFAGGEPFAHSLLIVLFLSLSAPVTTVFLMRAALFRERLARRPGVPRTLGERRR